MRSNIIELFGRKGIKVEDICEKSKRLTSWGSILAVFLSIYVSREVQLMILSESLLGIISWLTGRDKGWIRVYRRRGEHLHDDCVF